MSEKVDDALMDVHEAIDSICCSHKDDLKLDEFARGLSRIIAANKPETAPQYFAIKQVLFDYLDNVYNDFESTIADASNFDMKTSQDELASRNSEFEYSKGVL